MPELPEVETIRSDLTKFIKNKEISSVDIRLERLIKSNLNEFKKILKSNSFNNISRIGKLLIFHLKNNPDKYLLIHLKMTGQLVYCKKNNTIAGGHSTNEKVDCRAKKYSYVIFKFKDKSKLFFNDMRTFGALRIVNSTELVEITEKYGPEPLQLNFKLSDLKKIITKRNINIKSLLLNQNIISGIGNIYADEILFDAKILPDRIAKSLSIDEIEKLFKSSNKIIKKAIKERGTTFNNYVDGRGNKGNFIKFLKVYGRGGKDCTNCGNALTKTKIAGRGTVYCSKCQK